MATKTYRIDIVLDGDDEELVKWIAKKESCASDDFRQTLKDIFYMRLSEYRYLYEMTQEYRGLEGGKHMKNSEFKVGDHIVVRGKKGIVTEIERMKEYKYSFNGKEIGVSCFDDETVSATRDNGYTLEETGRTGTYFKVSFLDEELKDTYYDGATYGCIDDFENYGTW